MNINQSKAWDCLTEKEQQSLSLTLSYGKSTREAGQILELSHYKYLELKARSEKFFRLFSDYFDLHPSLINPEAPIEPKFRDYLFGTILKRLSKEDAIIYAGDSSFHLDCIKRPAILRNMGYLKESENEWDKHLYTLIVEFDRWNSYRILPRSIQAPSAYQRRNNRRDKVYLRFLHQIPEFKIRGIIGMYWKGGKPEKRYFMAIISTDVYPDDGYGIVPVKRDEQVVKELTAMKLYLFEEQLDAEIYGQMVNNYFESTFNSASGLRFWKEYREIIEKAINYKEINNLDFTTENLDNAFSLKRKKRR